MEGFNKYLFIWDEIPGKENNRLREFIIHNYAPKLSQTAQIEKCYELFGWDEIPGNDNVKLIEFLKQKFGIDWVKTAEIKKNDSGNTIKVSNEISLNLNQEKTEVIFKIDDVRTDKFIAKMENGKLNIYCDENTIKIYDNKSTVFLLLDTDKRKVIVKINDKTDEFFVTSEKDKKDDNEKLYIYPTNPLQGPGNRFVGNKGIILIGTYLLLFSVILIYSLIQFWPLQVNSSNSPITLFQWKFFVSDEGRLFIIVAIAGALGSLVHALKSFYWYVGNRELIWSWLAMYFILPVSGATLGIIFYIAIRGGLFPQATIQQTSPFGFAALSALVGLFSVQASLKLQDIAETVFTKAGEGQDSKPQKKGRENTGGKKDE